MIADEPLLSPRRVLGAMRQWFYFAIIDELDVHLWTFIVYHRRPEAAHRDGVY